MEEDKPKLKRPAKRKGGRSTPLQSGNNRGKMSRERMDLVLAALRAGLSYMSAATAAGISISALNDWRACDDAFALECEQAIVNYEQRLVDIINFAAEQDRDWKAALAMLERRFKKEWGKDFDPKDNLKQNVKLEIKWDDDGQGSN